MRLTATGPRTTIAFTLQCSSYVELQVFDAAGSLVETLILRKLMVL